MSDNGGSFFAGFAIGALAGAAAALLLAPVSGDELRKQIGDKGIELKEQAQQQVSYVQEQGRIVLSENAKKAQQAVQEAQAKLSKPGEAA
jgi:gas vesicle protein